MKKFILAAVIAFFGLSGANAQLTGFEAGAYVGIPVGDAKDISSFNFGIEAAYYWNVAENFKAGILTGYDYFPGKEIKGASIFDDDIPGINIPSVKFNMGFIPIAASAKYDFGGWFGGLDLGYAIYAGDGGGDGGFLYRPRAGWSGATFDVFAFYKGISRDGANISSLGVGFDYKF